MVSLEEVILKMFDTIEIFPREKQFEEITQLYKPEPANKYLPEWYKKQVKAQKENDDTLFASNCPAIRDYMLDGLVIPLWSDIEITFGEKHIEWQVTLGRSLHFDTEVQWITNHNISQTKYMDINTVDYGALKLCPPYYFSTKKNVGIEFVDVFYHFRKDIRLFPGRVESDIWNEINFPFEFYRPAEELIGTKMIIEAGTPLMIARTYDITRKKTKLKFNKYGGKKTKNFAKLDVLNASRSYDWKRYRKLFR